MTDESEHNEDLRIVEDTRIEEEDKFFCRFTFGQFFALLIFQAITLFFIFYLGARYGRELLGMEENIARSAVANGGVITTAPDANVNELADELIKKSRPAQLKERVAELLKETNVSDEPPKLKIDEEKFAQKKEEGIEATNAVEGAVRIVSPATSKFSLQIGAYQKMSEAADNVDKWKTKGYPAYMMIADLPDRGRWYRVRIGSYAEQNEAEAFRQQLQQKENLEALVVINER